MQAVRAGYTLAIAIDGPRGPFRLPKVGPLEIARDAGVPVVPVAARATREWRVPSWDRFRVPCPRAHVALVYGEPLWFPEGDPDGVELAHRQHRLAVALNELDAAASARVGRRDAYPPPGRLAWMAAARSEPAR
jgi:hypothetical protein